MMQTVEEALDWIYSQKSPHRREGLDKIVYALDLLNHPHKKLKTIHIGGTNGKGSTINYLEGLFKAHKLKVGTFTSPHMLKWNERIKVNGHPISDQDLIKLTRKMVELNQRMEVSSFGRLGFFELYTVMMFEYFGSQTLDIALIEVGLGGRLDATNVIASPYIGITSIGLDHQDRLGNELEEIAFEKAGIIHQSAQVWIGNLDRRIEKIIEARCYEVGAQLHEPVRGKLLSQSVQEGLTFSWENQTYHLSILGRHQVGNVSLALQIFHTWMHDHEQVIRKEEVARALSQSQWMGRMEEIMPRLFLEGAHNEEGLRTLNQTLNDLMANQRIGLLYAGLKTKDQSRLILSLSKMPIEKIYLTTFDHLDASQEGDFIKWLDDLMLKPDERARFYWQADWRGRLDQMLQEYDQVIVTGSLYFVAQVREFLLG